MPGKDHDSDGKNLMNPSARKLNKHLTTKSLKEILLIEQDKDGEKGVNLICNYDIAHQDLLCLSGRLFAWNIAQSFWTKERLSLNFQPSTEEALRKNMKWNNNIH